MCDRLIDDSPCSLAREKSSVTEFIGLAIKLLKVI